jgi:hypothetical protein
LFVIGELWGLSTIRAYYDGSTRALVGYYEIDDVGTVICSGRVPKRAWEWAPSDYGGLTDVRPLCAPDGGALPGDAGMPVAESAPGVPPHI